MASLLLLLLAECEHAQAQEYGRVLEAAYSGFEKFFQAKPRLGRGDKLRDVRWK